MFTEPDSFAADITSSRPLRFFHLEAGGSDAEPESLLSWLIGLSRAHSVSPRVLMRHLIEESTAYEDVWHGTTFFDRDAVTVNGHGRYAEMMVGIFQSQVSIGLRSMTMLGISPLFPHNGEGLLARSPRWCAHCMCDQVRAGLRPHSKLVWAFEYYRVCDIHRVRMRSECQACGCKQSFAPIYPSIVHCSACGHSLLKKDERDEDISENDCSDFELWCSRTVTDMVARRDQLGFEGSLESFRANLVQIVHKLSPGNRKRLCESVGLQAYALNGWINKDERPSLSVLLKLCFGVGLNVADIFLPDAVTIGLGFRGVSPSDRERCSRPLLGFQRRRQMEDLLDVVIADTADCRPLSKVAEQLGLTRSAMKYWFKSQCRQIVAKNRSFESRRLEVRYSKDHEFLHSIVQGLYAQRKNPSRRRVDSALAQKGLSLARPDLFRAFEELRRPLQSD